MWAARTQIGDIKRCLPVHPLLLAFAGRRSPARIWRNQNTSSPLPFCRASTVDSVSGEKAEALNNSNEAPLSAYVHLPFCKRRCYYCDFPVQAVGSDPGLQRVQTSMQQYVNVLCSEIRATEALAPAQLQTVFFGGGTPSLTPPSMVGQILQCLTIKFGIAETAEISMEVDPGTFNADRLQEYRALGVSRFSIGIQAFEEDVLAACGRSHTLLDVHQAIRDVKAAGVTNWSLDLISGLPHTSLASWQMSLEQALAADPSHISIYDLQVEDQTKFSRLYQPGKFPLPPDELTAQMYCTASETLRARGMEHYEISSYAKPGFRCRHNSTYWSGMPFYAFGLGAASYLQCRRFSRPRSMSAYQSWVSEFERSGNGTPGGEGPPEGAEERLLDAVMLRLRLSDGLDCRILTRQFGAAMAGVVEDALRPHELEGLVERSGDCVRLQDPKGFLVSNNIISDVFAAIDDVKLVA